MRILLISAWKPRKGGITTHVENLVERSKNDFVVLTYNSHEEMEGVLRARYINIPILRALSFVFFGFFKGLKVNCDLIHAHYAVPQGLLGVLLKKAKKKPLVTTLHGSDVTILMKNRLGKKIVRYVLKNSDKVIAVSTFLKGEVEKEGITKEKMAVVYSGVSTDGCEEPKNGEAITFIGSLVQQKGVDILLNAFKDVKERFDIGLTIVGDGKERKNLESLAKRLKLEGVDFLGYSDDLRGILEKSKVLVLPSREEGFGLVLLEAMSCGVPIVATRVGGIEEIVRHNYNGVLVEKEDAEDLARGILRVLEDKGLREAIRKNSREFVKRFSWEKMADEVDKIYEELGGHKGRRPA
jgi:N-acetyl-alpha-D-glucosaminyl L-malate synthase BshA